MEPLKIESTESSPNVILDPASDTFLIEGSSFPNDAVKFYDQIIQWLHEYGNKPNAETNFTFNLEYFNSSSAKFLLEVLRMLTDMRDKGANVKITWVYYVEDEDMKYAGEEFSRLSKLPFEFICEEEED